MSKPRHLRAAGHTHIPAIVPKRDKTLTFSATIRRDVDDMKTITVITILALLTISGAVISDQILTGQASRGGGSLLTFVGVGGLAGVDPIIGGRRACFPLINS